MNSRFRLRAVAAALLRTAIRFAPARAADWGRAMLAELDHVESDWAALAWALGGASFLAKQTILSALFPSPDKRMPETGERLFAKEASVRKNTRVAAVACLAASLLFFAAPTFRHAFRVATTQWHALGASLVSGNVNFDYSADYRPLIEQARKNHDANALAFVALNRYGPEAAPVADEAVAINPQLTWIYAGVAGRNVPQLDDDARIAKLKQFDPQNAMPYVVEATVLVSRHKLDGKSIFNGSATDSLWLNAMSLAFHSREIDTYKDRIAALDRDVRLRYGLDDPVEAQSEYTLVSGVYPGLASVGGYVRHLLGSGDALAAGGDFAGAEQQYRLAANFGEELRQSGTAPIFVAALLREPYLHLATFYQKQGDAAQSAHYAGLAAAMRQAQDDAAASRRLLYDPNFTSARDARVVSLASMMLFVCIAALPLCVLATIAKSGSLRPSKLRFDGFTRIVSLAAVAGLLLSSAAIYLSYRPYVRLVDQYLRDGDANHLRPVAAFTSYLSYATWKPLYTQWTFPMYFYGAVVVLCAMAFLVVVAKFVWQRQRSQTTA